VAGQSISSFRFYDGVLRVSPIMQKVRGSVSYIAVDGSTPCLGDGDYSPRPH
jgi:hypothetical protein